MVPFRIICRTPIFKGISPNRGNFVFVVHTDDLLLMTPDLRHNLEPILKGVQMVGALSGYRININKCKALRLKGPENPYGPWSFVGAPRIWEYQSPGRHLIYIRGTSLTTSMH